MRRSTFVLPMVFLLVPAAAAAQHRIGAAFEISSPRGEFDANTDTGFGFGLRYRYGFGPGGLVSIGANGSFQNYGSARRRAPLSTTIPEIEVEISTTNNIFYLEGALELAVPAGRLQPYAVASYGAGFFYTTSSLKDPLTNETVLTDTNQSDWTWVWSAGGGLRILLRELPRPEGGEPGRLFLDLGASRVAGGDVEYLREGTLVTDEGEFDIDERLARSEIELILYRIGVTYQF